jgi:hypothetical protein
VKNENEVGHIRCLDDLHRSLLCLFIEEKSYFVLDDETNLPDVYTRLSLAITQCLRDYDGEINHAKRRVHDVRIG